MAGTSTATAATASSSITLTEDDFHDDIHKSVGKPSQKVIYIGHGKSRKRQVVSKTHTSNWAESYVNIATKTVKTTVYIDYKDRDITPAEFSHLQRLASSGINQYWSDVITVGGLQFSVTVDVIERKHKSIDAKLKINRKNKYARSHNSGVVDAVFVYNKGFFTNSIDAENDFKHVAAHEFGHSILDYFGGWRLSWGHKGSTNAILQKVKSKTPGYPSSGNIDIMKYYDWDKAPISNIDLHTRSKAEEIDIKRLIWLSKLTFIK